MIIPDANLLIYAYDSTLPAHKKAKAWWELTLNQSEPVGIPWVVVLAFVRLMTHPRVTTNPLTITQARQYVQQWFEAAHVRLLYPSENTLRQFFDLLEAVELGGNLSTDALIAAHALENSAAIHSNDIDFKRFSGLKLVNPLER